MSAITTGSGGASNIAKQIRGNLQTYALIVATIVIWGVFFFVTDGAYLGAQNFSNLFRQMTVTALLSVGMVLIIVTGGIDLSVGNFAGFISVVVAKLQNDVWRIVLPDQPLLAAVLSVLIGLAVAVLFGMIQGSVVAYMRVPAFIVTLGGMWVFKGALLIVTEGKTIAANQPYFSQIGQGYLPALVGWILAIGVVLLIFYNTLSSRQRKRRYGFELGSLSMDLLKATLFAAPVVGYVFYVNQYHGIPVPVLILAIAAVVVSYVSSNTRFGRYAYALGGNREATRLSGVNINNNIFKIFVLMGFLCGVSGVVLASYVGYGTIAAGFGYELDAIAACILGGTSPLGGVGTIFGAMVGSLIMASLTNGLQIMNVPASYQYVVKGIILVLAVYADVQLKKNR
ncbi:MAG: sugar ABC transporter permease [Thermoflexales bacterium]|nr:sugar ABC transporter permease [Thermoflexales bacterium]